METMIGRFLETLGRNSVEAGMLVLVVLLAQWCFGKKIAPRWRCALWLLVMARLLLPVSTGSVVSLFNLFPNLENMQPPVASRPVPQEARQSVVQNSLAVPAAELAPRINSGAPPESVGLSVRIKGYKLSKSNPSLDWLNGRILGRVTGDMTNLDFLLEPGAWQFNQEGDRPDGADAYPVDKPLRGVVH
jgi:hypothetical protein